MIKDPASQMGQSNKKSNKKVGRRSQARKEAKKKAKKTIVTSSMQVPPKSLFRLSGAPSNSGAMEVSNFYTSKPIKTQYSISTNHKIADWSKLAEIKRRSFEFLVASNRTMILRHYRLFMDNP